MIEIELSFEKMPHYFYSANRQFEKDECHVNRIFGFSVLILMRKGILRFADNGVNVELTAGEYYIQQANTYQQGITPSDMPNYYFIHFKGHFDKSGGLPIRGKFDIDKIQEIIVQIDSLGNKAQKLEYENLFYSLLVELKNSNTTQINSPESIRAYLLENFQKNVTLNELSKKFFLSPNQIINIFKTKYGSTPYQLLLDFRLKRARELILATDTSIQAIAFEVGFKDYTAFYRAFIKKFELSPQKYRDTHSVDLLPSDVYWTYETEK